jgi:chitinase
MNVVTEHIQERQTEPRAQEFMMNGETQRRDGVRVRSHYPIIDRDYLDPNSFLFRDYSQWDPNGPYTGRPIDEITNAYGSDTNPGVLVNTDSVLNGYKARVWVGSQAMGDDLWDSNGFHHQNSELAGAAIATIRTAIQVISYLNDDEVNRAWSTVINTVVAAYGRYQERVLAVTGVQINPREMYQEYMNEVVIRNLENSIESWVNRRIGQLRRVWEPLRGIDPDAEGILQDLRRLERTMRDEFIDTSRMDIT